MREARAMRHKGREQARRSRCAVDGRPSGRSEGLRTLHQVTRTASQGTGWQLLGLATQARTALTNMKGMPAMNSWVPRSGGGDDRAPALQAAAEAGPGICHKACND